MADVDDNGFVVVLSFFTLPGLCSFCNSSFRGVSKDAAVVGDMVLNHQVPLVVLFLYHTYLM